VTPDGQTFNQKMANQLSLGENYMIICGHYKGIDQRIRDRYITREISVGDFVLSGGELGAMVMLDAIIRYQPGALGHEGSAAADSFADGLLDCPQYTRPQEYQGDVVPAVLLGGNHEQIRLWRLKQSLGSTWLKRPDLLQRMTLTDEQKVLLEQFIGEYYIEQGAGR